MLHRLEHIVIAWHLFLHLFFFLHALSFWQALSLLSLQCAIPLLESATAYFYYNVRSQLWQ